MENILYECGICGGLHPWSWDGDCREDVARYHSPEGYAQHNGVPIEGVQIRSWEERLEADGMNF